MRVYPSQDDLDNALRHRQQENYMTNPYYDQQQRMLEATPLDEPLPKEIVVRYLPTISKTITTQFPTRMITFVVGGNC